jgi:hypothetical protein
MRSSAVARLAATAIATPFSILSPRIAAFSTQPAAPGGLPPEQAKIPAAPSYLDDARLRQLLDSYLKLRQQHAAPVLVGGNPGETPVNAELLQQALQSVRDVEGALKKYRKDLTLPASLDDALKAAPQPLTTAPKDQVIMVPTSWLDQMRTSLNELIATDKLGNEPKKILEKAFNQLTTPVPQMTEDAKKTAEKERGEMSGVIERLVTSEAGRKHAEHLAELNRKSTENIHKNNRSSNRMNMLLIPTALALGGSFTLWVAESLGITHDQSLHKALRGGFEMLHNYIRASADTSKVQMTTPTPSSLTDAPSSAVEAPDSKSSNAAPFYTTSTHAGDGRGNSNDSAAP